MIRPETFRPKSKAFRVEMPVSKHLPYPTIVLAVCGEAKERKWFRDRTRRVVRVWNIEARVHPQQGPNLVPHTGMPIYEKFFYGTDHHEPLRNFILSINRPTVTERLMALLK